MQLCIVHLAWNCRAACTSLPQARLALVCVGAKEKQQIYDAFENIYAVLKMFKKGDVPAPAMAAPQHAALVSVAFHLCS